LWTIPNQKIILDNMVNLPGNGPEPILEDIDYEDLQFLKGNIEGF